MIQLWSSNNAALVLAREIFRREPKSAIQIFLGGEKPQGVFSVSDLWKTAIEQSIQTYSHLGIAIDGAKDGERESVASCDEKVFNFEYELLSSFAERGLADTVEFRRLARKYLRPARNAHCDGVLFLSGILASESSRKVLAKMTGSKVKTVFVTDFIPKEVCVPAEKQRVEIFTNQDEIRVHQEAEKILRMKLAKGAVKNI